MLIPLHYIINTHFGIMYPKNCLLSNIEIPLNQDEYTDKIDRKI